MVTKENQRFLLVYKVMNDIVYPYTTRGWTILDYTRRVARKHHEIVDRVVFPGNTSSNRSS
jgi:hypothetical protein